MRGLQKGNGMWSAKIDLFCYKNILKSIVFHKTHFEHFEDYYHISVIMNYRKE